MQPAELAMRRFLVQGGLFATIAAVAFLVSLLLCGTAAYISNAASVGLRETIESADAADSAVRVQVRLASDPESQASAVESAVDQVFGTVPIHLNRTVQSSPLDALVGESPVSIVLGADAKLVDRANLESGHWPTAGQDPVETIVHALAAQAFDLSIGDELALGEGGSRVVVVGTWLPLDPEAKQWFGDPLVADGQLDSHTGPFMIEEADFASLPASPFARWTVLLNTSKVIASDLPEAVAAVGSLNDSLSEQSELTSGGFIFEGGLGQTLDSLERGAAAIRGVTPVPTILTAVLGLMTILQLARLLAAARSTETDLLRARGASVAQLTRQAALEALGVSIVPTAFGALAALASINLLSTGSTQWQDVATITGAVAVMVLLALVAVAAREASRANARDRPRESGRGTRTAALATLVFAIAAAGISLWQFRLYGTPIVESASGERVVDPIAVLAPSLNLLACAVVSLALFAPLALLAERVSSRSNRLEFTLAARQVARRLPLFAMPVLLVSLSVGGATVAAAYAQTWSALSESAGQLRNGADVRVLTAGPSNVGSPVSLNTSTAYSEVDGVNAAAPVLIIAVETGERAASLVGIDAGSVGAVMSLLDGALDTERVGADIAGSVGVELPAGATALSIQFTTDVISPVGQSPVPGQGDTELRVWLTDAQGVLTRVLLEPATDGAATTPIPSGTEPWSILGVDVAIDTGIRQARYDFSISSVVVSLGTGEELVPVDSAAGWVLPGTEADELGPVASAPGSDPGFTATLDGTTQAEVLRLMPAAERGSLVDPIPAVVTAAFAAQMGVIEGDGVTLQFTGTGRSLDVEVAGTVAMLPGADSSLGVVADLTLLNDQLLRTSSTIPRAAQMWLSTDVPSDVAADAAAIAGRGGEVTTLQSGSANAFLSAAAVGLWVGAIGSLVLAAVAVAAVVGSLSTSRRGEVAVLRVLGMSSRQQAAGRRRELFIVALFAGLFGLIGGMVVSWLVVPELARSAVLDAPTGLAAPLQVALLPLVALLLAFAAAIAVIGWSYGARVERQARNASPREDSL